MELNKKIVRILLLIVLPIMLNAGTTGKIGGTVLDKSTGEALVGCNVFINDILLGASTDLEGNYYILNVPPGKYTLEVSSIGYRKIVISDVVVISDRTTSQDFVLEPEVLEGEAVIVIASRPIVEKDRTNSMSSIDSDQIDALPVQEVEDIIQLQTGVTRDASGKFHMRGGRSGEIAYLVDGIPVTDQFGGGSSVEIENSWVQELQVISGTFNAEYGQAQSGVINVVSKRGRRKFSGKASIWMGDHISSNNDVFMNIDRVNLGEYNAEVSFGGPLNLLPSGSYYVSFRNYDREGWLYGKRETRIEDTWKIQEYYHEAQQNPTDEERISGIKIPDSLKTGDGSYVPLNPLEKYTGYATLDFTIGSSVNFKYSLFANTQTWKSYSDSRRYAPDGVGEKYRTGFNHILNMTHTLTPSTFYKLGFSYSTKTEESYLFENPLDPRYQGSELSLNGFYFGGTADGRGYEKLQTLLGKFDITSQVNRHNLLQMGTEVKQHSIDYKSSKTISRTAVYRAPNLEVPDINTAGNNAYTQNPVEAAIYVQNKLEFDEIIFNAGVRFDYWDSRADVLKDYRAITDGSDGIRLNSDKEKSEAKYQLSPRLGLAFPISTKGVIHVSYGHFFQTPRFSYIFRNSEFEVELGDLETIMGNANLEPEKNIAYEIGLQQELAFNWGLQITAYYKDIKNLLGQEIISTDDKKVYARYINRDYGNVKGITVALEKGFADKFGGSIDYTYQVARGNASDPNSVFSDFQSNPPRESEKQVLPLDWDQTHTINARVNVGDPKDWNVGIIGRFATGQPYTPSNPGSALTTQFENSDRKPSIYNIDLNIYKILGLYGYKVKVFGRIYNLLDTLNENRVYSSTGTSEFPFRTNAEREILERNPNFSLNEIDLRPDFYTQPRRVVLGISVSF